jgi:NAD(P)-dependent dehydrogenase (short-subunit alcohol dehydrogenase family)
MQCGAGGRTLDDRLFSLAGKTALVTGGTSGIGRMIAAGLAERGVKTFITGRDQAAANKVATEISGPGEAIGLAADFAEENASRRLAAALGEQADALHLLVNNAGTMEASPIEETERAAWDELMAVNLAGPYFLVQALLPLLRAAGTAADPARIVNLGSIGGMHIPNWEAYCYGASKAAVHHLTRALAKRLGRDHITVNAVAPGPFPSRMNDTSTEMIQKSIDTYIPLKRAGEPDDAVGAVVFLASRAGAYVNGHTIPLDGGYIAAL